MIFKKNKFIKRNLIIITGGDSGLAKKLCLLLKEKKFTVFSVRQKEYDLTSLKNIYRLLKKINKIGKSKKILFINNASTLGDINRLGKLSNKKIVKTLNLNILTPYLLINFFLKKKVIGYLNITSGAAFTYINKLSLYSITKLATHKLFNYIKKENSNNFFYVKNFNPGILKTNMNKILIKNKILSKKNISNDVILAANKILKICNKFFS